MSECNITESYNQDGDHLIFWSPSGAIYLYKDDTTTWYKEVRQRILEIAITLGGPGRKDEIEKYMVEHGYV